jgi:hypothetical protein
MTDSLYLLSFAPLGLNPNSSQVDIFVRSHRDITSWYCPFAGSYYFRSSKALIDILPSFRQFFGSSQFAISFVVPTLVGGSLPENVWQWIVSGMLPALSSS